MTVSPAKQAAQVRATLYGPQIGCPSQTPPTSSTQLWTVSGGRAAITSLNVVVTGAMSSTTTTLNIGCYVAGTFSATNLMNAGVLTSLASGANVAGVPALTAGWPTLTGDVLATPGGIFWIASATQTGTCVVYLSYIPIDAGVTIG